MADDFKTPATKADLKKLRKEIQVDLKEFSTKGDLRELRKEMKEDLNQKIAKCAKVEDAQHLMNEFGKLHAAIERIEGMEDRIVHQIQVIAENEWRSQIQGITERFDFTFNKANNNEKRIDRLERHVGFRA